MGRSAGFAADARRPARLAERGAIDRPCRADPPTTQNIVRRTLRLREAEVRHYLSGKKFGCLYRAASGLHAPRRPVLRGTRRVSKTPAPHRIDRSQTKFSGEAVAPAPCDLGALDLLQGRKCGLLFRLQGSHRGACFLRFAEQARRCDLRSIKKNKRVPLRPKVGARACAGLAQGGSSFLKG